MLTPRESSRGGKRIDPRPPEAKNPENVYRIPLYRKKIGSLRAEPPAAGGQWGFGGGILDAAAIL